MSLALLQGYSSAEEEEEEPLLDENSSDDDIEDIISSRSRVEKSLFDLPKPSGKSLLPSAFEAFSEISGPPEFLNNSVSEHASVDDIDKTRRRGGRKYHREKKDLPAGVVMEAKAQLVGIHDRVRSDTDGNLPPKSSVPPQKGSMNTVSGEGKRVPSATVPDAKDASELLRMCLQCGIPKTYSNTRGMVCPVCGDRPPVDKSKETEKKKGSAIKEKEKNKRFKGQSTHSTWKSETEMQLRQQFD
ncbi:PREDICTED: uncharacterized protein LOC104605955 [Nelumbo nucifera]|uniref:Uncharacterized protein LOC104605955 n=1 Tax=Nelumbo nucifera TaxID=4432 RepID=A0A1U8B088_NELNU|nr:PREDICTED: uncharacterized protein LOC104605955 [Nelumbo nucifera]